MVTCPLCGTQTDAFRAACVACGRTLDGADAGTVPTGVVRASQDLKRTLVGGTRLGAEHDSSTPREAAPPQPTESVLEAGPPRAKLQGTLLGFGALGPAPTPLTALSEGPAAAAPLGDKRTLLGGNAQPGFAAPPPTQLPERALPAALEPPLPATGSDKRTLLGVARPGIAPTGRAAPLPPPPPLQEGLPPPPLAPRKKGRAILGGALGAAALLGGVAAALWSPSAPQVEVSSLRVGALGDEIVLKCSQCSDGVRATLGASRAEFKNGEAIIKTDAPLTVGEHRLSLGITPEKGGATSSVELVVPVAFRARALLASIGDDVPSAGVEVSAPSGSKVTVDSNAVELDAHGVARYRVPLDAETTGEEASSKSFSQKLTVTVTPPGGTARHSTVELGAAVTPLVLGGPGPRVVLRGGDLIVSGRTAPNATVRVGAARAKADAEGRFIVTLRAPDAGAHRVIATGEGLATRAVTVDVTRTAATHPEPLGFDELLAAKVGSRVALVGQVVDARSQPDGSSLLLEVKQGCSKPPCLVGALYPARLVAGMPKRDQQLLAVGDASPPVDGAPRLRLETFGPN